MYAIKMHKAEQPYNDFNDTHVLHQRVSFTVQLDTDELLLLPFIYTAPDNRIFTLTRLERDNPVVDVFLCTGPIKALARFLWQEHYKP